MLSKKLRLNLKIDFKRMISGKKIETKFSRIFIQTSRIVSPRIGIALSGKVFKQATERHRAKRLLSVAFESLYDSLPQGLEILTLPKANITSVKSAEVQSDLKAALIRAGIIPVESKN